MIAPERVNGVRLLGVVMLCLSERPPNRLLERANSGLAGLAGFALPPRPDLVGTPASEAQIGSSAVATT